jgi:hypothetical protein
MVWLTLQTPIPVKNHRRKANYLFFVIYSCQNGVSRLLYSKSVLLARGTTMMNRSQANTEEEMIGGAADSWRQALKAKSLRSFKSPDWLKLAALPGVTLGGQVLAETQVLDLLAALKASILTAPHPLVRLVKAEGEAIAEWAWAVFWSWHHGNGEGKDNWAMMGLGLLGDDTTVFKLTPLLREMPGNGLHKRAALGLECFATIGSDIALMHINSIAQKIKYKSLKTKAESCMTAIGKARNLTREQLEDRIVPDCGFGEDGNRRFDYGTGGRSFGVRFGDELQLVVQDAQGKVIRSLPKATAKEDGTIVAAAIADWKLMKKQVAAVVKEQTHRLELAMVNLRRWSVADFEAITLRHPVLRQMARQLVWVGEGPVGTQTFRVTEDWTYGTQADEALELSTFSTVGIVHPAQLGVADRSQWGELLSDYGIIPPFRQLTRTIFELESQEAGAMTIDRFKGVRVPSLVASSILKNTGWNYGYDSKQSHYMHYKSIAYANVTAIVQHDGDFRMDYDMRAVLGSVWFVAGEEWTGDPIALANVHPVALSEVLRLVGAIAAKAEES